MTTRPVTRRLLAAQLVRRSGTASGKLMLTRTLLSNMLQEHGRETSASAPCAVWERQHDKQGWSHKRDKSMRVRMPPIHKLALPHCPSAEHSLPLVSRPQSHATLI